MSTKEGIELREYIDIQVKHLKELMQQHDKLSDLAIVKSEDTYNERFSKVNAFREQQHELIQTFAKSEETRGSFLAVNEKFEANLKSVTERFDKGQITMTDKISFVQTHLDEKILSSINVQENKFSSTDRQMQTLIDANAEISNRGLKELNLWKEGVTGSIRVMLTVGGFIAAIVLALIIGFLKTIF